MTKVSSLSDYDKSSNKLASPHLTGSTTSLKIYLLDALLFSQSTLLLL